MTQPDDADRTTRHDTSPYTSGSASRDASPYASDSSSTSAYASDSSPYASDSSSGGTSPYASGSASRDASAYASDSSSTSAYASPYGGSTGDTTTRDGEQQWSFDDMYGGEQKSHTAQLARPVRDRLWPHLVWEVLLAGGVVLMAIVVVIAAGSVDAITGRPLESLLVQLAFTGFVVSGFALSLRAATPNLAVGGVAALSATLVAWLSTEQNWNPLLAAVVTVGLALVTGLVLAALVVGLHVPSWAVTLGVGVLLVTLTIPLSGGRTIALRDGSYGWPWVWSIAFVVLSALGGLLCATPGVRAFLGSPRRLDDAPLDPAARPGGRAGAAATVALVGSTTLAAVGGAVLIFWQRASIPGGGNDLTIVALAVALLAGVSAYGRRGGILGVVLATAVFVLARHALLIAGVEGWVTSTVPIAGALLLGLVATRFVEATNRRRADTPS